MDEKLLLDVEVNVIDEKLFKVIFYAELKYCSAVFPFLKKCQIKGKALQMMGISADTGELSKLMRLIPFIYKRKIAKPKEKWKLLFTCLTFKPAFIFADKCSCLKIITNTKHSSQFCSLGIQFTEESSNVISTKHHNISRVHVKLTNCKKFREYLSKNNTDTIKDDGKIHRKKLSYTPCIRLQQERIFHNNQHSLHKSLSKKLSESIATIEWPFQSLNLRKAHKNIHSQKRRNISQSVGKKRRNVKGISKECLHFEGFKENVEPVNNTNSQKRRKIDTAPTVLNLKSVLEDDNFSSSSEEYSAEKMSESQSGILAEMFNPISKKSRSPPVTPIIKIRGSSQE